jgi:hypothetical protein
MTHAAAKPKTFHDTISPLLELKLKRFSDGKQTKLDRATCLEIYNEVFNVFVGVITPTNIPLTNESMNYIAQQYYDGILINGRQELDPEIFTERASLDKIPTPELKLVAMMLRGTDFLIPVVKALKGRGQA